MKRLWFVNKEGERLCGILEGDAKEMVIFCHGFMGRKDSALFVELAQEIRKVDAYSTLRFDFSGNGESEGCFEDATISKEVEDLHAVITDLESKGYTIAALIGYSKGGTDVLVHQARFSHAKTVVAIAPKVYGERGINERFTEEQLTLLDTQGWFWYEAGDKKVKISKAYLNERKTTYADIRLFCKQITVPTLIVHGTKDRTVSFEESQELYEAIKDHAHFIPIEGADHHFRDPFSRTQLIAAVTEWVSDADD